MNSLHGALHPLISTGSIQRLSVRRVSIHSHEHSTNAGRIACTEHVEVKPRMLLVEKWHMTSFVEDPQDDEAISRVLEHFQNNNSPKKLIWKNITQEYTMKKLFLLNLIILAVFLTACSSATAATPEIPLTSIETKTSEVVAEGKLLPATYVELAFIQPGIVAEALVTPGDKVSSGTVIARLKGGESVQAELEAARLEKILVEQTLDALQRQALLSAAEAEATFFTAQERYDTEADRWNPTDREEASDLERRLDDYVETEVAYRTARQELEDLLDQDEDDRQRQDAQKEFDDEKENLAEAFADLLQAVAENNESLDQRQVDILLLIANLEVAREQLDRLEENIDPDLISVAEARLEATQAHITAAEAALENYELRAPFAGTILSLNNLIAGQTINAGVPVAFLADLSNWQVETTDLAEIDVASVILGAPATIKLDAFPGEDFSAKVIEIDPVGREHLGDMTYKVTLELDEPDSRFLWNMTATVTIQND